LILDVGVETLFKAYLMLPENISKTQLRFYEREKAVKGGFHRLTEAIRKSNPQKIASSNLVHVEYYHKIRNKLYHDGEGCVSVCGIL